MKPPDWWTGTDDDWDDETGCMHKPFAFVPDIVVCKFCGTTGMPTPLPNSTWIRVDWGYDIIQVP